MPKPNGESTSGIRIGERIINAIIKAVQLIPPTGAIPVPSVLKSSTMSPVVLRNKENALSNSISVEVKVGSDSGSKLEILSGFSVFNIKKYNSR